MDFPGERLVIKLWETVAEKGVGSLFKPWQMRREGRVTLDLKRDELLTIAQAEHDAQKIRRGEITLANRLSQSTLLPEQTNNASVCSIAVSEINIADTIRREANVTRALLHAEEALEADPQTPPDAKVNEDWLYRWRDNASEVSSEELRNLWGRLLAGEVKAPGTYSLRTLEFLRNLSQPEARAIAKMSPFVVGGAIYRDASEILEESGVTFGFLLHMQQLGVVSGVEAIGISVTWKSSEADRFVRVLTSNNMVLVASADDPNHNISLPIYQLSDIGRQVLSLGTFTPHIDYLKKVAEHLKAQSVKIELARYVNSSPGLIQLFDRQEL